MFSSLESKMEPSKEGRCCGKRKKSTKTMTVEGNHLVIGIKEFSWQIIYLKHGKMQRSRPDKNVVVTVISRRFVVSEHGEK